MADRHRVVILGGGFGGLYAAKALKNAPVDLTLIDRRNFHLFQPLLYQVATGSLSPGEIAAPLRAVLSKQRNTRVLLGHVTDIDPQEKTIWLEDGERVPYDALIVSTGSESSYFGNDAWHTWAPPLKTVEDATTIRHKILIAFEAAERVTDPVERQKWLTFVIVGAGPTGVELAGALGEIAHHTLEDDFRSIHPSDAKIILIDAAPSLLASYPPDLARHAADSLKKLGAEVRTGLMVTNVDGAGVTVKASSGTQQHIASHTVIWAAGVAVSEFGKVLAQRTRAPTDKAGRIKVDGQLTVPGFPDIFVVGDLAYLTDEHGKQLPGVAQVAMQSGAYAAKAIAARTRGEAPGTPFHYFNKGDLAVIGRFSAVANVFGLHLHGFPAWFVWLFIHLMYIVEFQSRLLVLIQWGFLYLTYNRGAMLITGTTASQSAQSPKTAAAPGQ
ncbi:MAG: NAD(P)/FAD-dependent oxidoreductase [Acidobacteriaceae bacterium]|nr:NAD(P)/FAD-dependent oxidoreductase [Acidobacteriaceae bacterium]